MMNLKVFKWRVRVSFCHGVKIISTHLQEAMQMSRVNQNTQEQNKAVQICRVKQNTQEQEQNNAKEMSRGNQDTHKCEQDKDFEIQQEESTLMVMHKNSNVPSWLEKQSSFYVSHVGYFVMLVFVGALALWVCPDKNNKPITFIDALYCSTSASTVTGLISLQIEDLHIVQQIIMLLLTILGSQVFTSLLPLYARRVAFRRVLCHQANSILFFFPHTKGNSSNFVQRLKLLWMRKVDIIAERIFRMSKIEELFFPEISAWKSHYLHYKAITYLNRVVLVYFVGVQVLGLVMIQIYLYLSKSASHVLHEKKVNLFFFSLYNSVTSFGNAGFTLLNDSMVPMRTHLFLLLVVSWVIWLGNTMFPSALWFIIRSLEIVDRNSSRKEVYGYLLRNPRKCFTHLFPRSQTMWLMVTVIGFNAVQIIFFCVLDWDSPALEGLKSLEKLVNIVFQTSATRSAGSNVVQLGQLSPAMLVLFLGFMHISVYPVYLSRQRTQALPDTNDAAEHYESQIPVQLRKLFARDSAHLFIIIFLLCIVESNNLVSDPLNYSIFNVVFEVISGFGNSGLSVGYNCSLSRDDNCKNVGYSLSGKWSTLGKILIVLSMFLGRHRGVPDNVDSALLFPRTETDPTQEMAVL